MFLMINASKNFGKLYARKIHVFLEKIVWIFFDIPRYLYKKNVGELALIFYSPF